MMHYTTIDFLVLESSAKNTRDVLISELVVSVQEFDGICLEKYEMVFVKITSLTKNARSKENYPRQWGLQRSYACMYFQVIHCRLRDFFSTGIVCSHRRDVCPWQQICKTHLCRFKSAS